MSRLPSRVALVACKHLTSYLPATCEDSQYLRIAPRLISQKRPLGTALFSVATTRWREVACAGSTGEWISQKYSICLLWRAGGGGGGGGAPAAAARGRGGADPS